MTKSIIQKNENNNIKTVLWITASFPPTMNVSSVRNLQLLKYISDFDWRAIVLCPGIKDTKKEILDLESDYIKYVRDTSDVNYFSYDNSEYLNPVSRNKLLYSPFAIPDTFIIWSLKALPAVSRILKNNKVDLVFTSCDPFSLNFLGATIQDKWEIPWATEFRDLWTLNPYFSLQRKLHSKTAAKILEPLWLKKCKGFVANTPVSKKRMIQKYDFLRSKTIVIRNGYEPEFVAIDQSNIKVRNKSIFFGGDIYPRKTGYHPEKILILIRKAISKGIINKEWEIHYAGKKFKEFSDVLNKAGLKLVVHDHGFLNTKDYYRLLASMSLILISQPENVNTQSWIPARIYDYMGIKGKIVCLADKNSELATLVKEYGYGLVCTFDEIGEVMLEKLRNFIHEHNGKKSISNDFLKQFSRREQAKQLCYFFDTLLLY